MPQVIITQRAATGLTRYRKLLTNKNPLAAITAGQVLEAHFEQLENNPEMGRPFTELPVLRELMIESGDSCYVALYRYEKIEDRVYVLAFAFRKKQDINPREFKVL
ncbi:type II toxin-antitoxin system RelE/ParE family toxin [Sodalis sp. RH21]|uniref:type II toxin-antitoxin system RelE/ParE family toxin n=1 Tax=unclassified Sodalis (in: enterobacteria) TaxID=2636512 RepID=UPI0039B4A700